MKHKVSELEGALLDAAVAKAEGLKVLHVKGYGRTFFTEPPDYKINSIGRRYQAKPGRGCAHYSTDWSDGGPIIERERVIVGPAAQRDGWWAGGPQSYKNDGYGPTPLIAAMRAYVASKFGDEVEL